MVNRVTTCNLVSIGIVECMQYLLLDIRAGRGRNNRREVDNKVKNQAEKCDVDTLQGRVRRLNDDVIDKPAG